MAGHGGNSPSALLKTMKRQTIGGKRDSEHAWLPCLRSAIAPDRKIPRPSGFMRDGTRLVVSGQRRSPPGSIPSIAIRRVLTATSGFGNAPPALRLSSVGKFGSGL